MRDHDETLATLLDAIVKAASAEGGSVWLVSDGRSPRMLARRGVCPDPVPALRRLMPSQRIGLADTTSDWHVWQSPETSRWVHESSYRVAGGVLTVATFHARGGEEERRRAVEAVGRLRPLLDFSLSLWSEQREANDRLRELSSAMNGVDLSVIVVDRDSRTLFASASGEALLEAGSGLCRRRDKLAAAELADTLRLQAAIAHVTASNAGESRTVPVLAVRRSKSRPLLVAITSCQGSSVGDANAVIYVVDPDKDRGVSLDPVCKLYGLSPVESRLACLLADGRSLSDAAVGMRVREQTARSYLKQIFFKTNTCRQAELVWLMLKSTIATRAGFLPTFV